MGGYTPTTGSLPAVDTFNTATGVWTTVNPLPTPRSLAGVAVTPAGTLLVIGGQNQSLSAGTTTLVPQVDFTATAAPVSVMGSSTATVASSVTNLTVVSPTVTSGQTASGARSPRSRRTSRAPRRALIPPTSRGATARLPRQA